MAEIRKRKQTKNLSKDGNISPATNDKPEDKPIKYGPLPHFRNQRVWARGVLVVCIIAVVYFTSNKPKETMLASQRQSLERRGLDVPCAESYTNEISAFPGCVPKMCGRVITDTLITKTEVYTLLAIARQGFALGGSDGGASILDIHSGALSHGKEFVNFYKFPQAAHIIKPQDYLAYTIVRTKIQHAIAQHFGIDFKIIHLTHPTFFSRLTNIPPKTVHDEYWHKHVDKETYESFHYTSLLYLNDYTVDFEGGRFVFVEQDNTTTLVEPRRGRVSMFTSGAENPHYVEKVKKGDRLAMTISFTCNKSKAIADPEFRGQGPTQGNNTKV